MSTQGRYQKILVPLDGSGWAQRAIPHASDIARSAGSELILLNVFTPPARQYIDQLTLAGQEDQVQNSREQMKQYLIGIRSELRNENISVRTHLIEGAGDAARLICDFVDSEGIDLIVMSSHGHTGIARLIFGSVARDVMECVQVPVLLIKPDKE